MGREMLAKQVNHVSDTELDMHRRTAQVPGRTMRWLLETVLSFQHAARAMGKPRRSIDREQQEYSPYSD
jgi:hypothetical protein